MPGQWLDLSYRIPALDNACLLEAGIEFIPEGGWGPLVVYVDDVDFTGSPDYAIDFAHERLEKWHGTHIEVSQFTYLRGKWTLDEGKLSGSYYGETAECYTGDLNWRDYEFTATVMPKLGGYHNIQFRVQGGIRSYAAGLAEGNRLCLYKNDNGYRELASVDLNWSTGQEYRIGVKAQGNRFEIAVDGEVKLVYVDRDRPYLNGMIGFSNSKGSHTHYASFRLKGLE